MIANPSMGIAPSATRPTPTGPSAARSVRLGWLHGLWVMALTLLLGGCGTLLQPAAHGVGGAATGVSDDRTDASAESDRSRRPRASATPGGSLSDIAPASTYALPVASLTPPADLWDRIRRGFDMPDLEGDLAQDRTEWYAARPDYFFRMTERSRKYLFHIVEELERRDMPTELALLPFVESAFNPNAVSSAKAAGMWQFMPATGKDFELRQNLFRDDRRDVLASTRAALDYLQMLHGMFNDWHLALAAYNWGQGSVKRAIERNQRRGLPTGYTDISMPQETRLYVPKLQAIKNLVRSPGAHGVRLPAIPNHPFFDTVPIERDMDVALAAQLAEVDEKDFRELNPSLHKPVILAAGTPHILLPWDNAITFKRNLQFHIGPLATWTAWAVPSSMRTAEIAKRFNMPENDLRSLNKIPPGMLVKAGSTVLVPRLGAAVSQEVPEHLADHAQLAFQPERVVKSNRIQVRKGDTLATLAKRHRVTAIQLAQWNQLSPKAALKPGQNLTLFTESTAAAKVAATVGSVRSAKDPSGSRRAEGTKASRQAVTPQRSRQAAASPSKRQKAPAKSSTHTAKR